jgi:predicted dehydrogenase
MSLVTHRYPFKQALDAYELITSAEEPYLGVLLEYPLKAPRKIIHLTNASKNVSSDGIKLGVIGAGNFARSVLLPRLSSNSDVTFCGITTGRGMTAKAVGDQFRFQYCANTGDKIIEDANVNTILVATRHDSHSEYVIKAFEAGKSVFVEKPLCLNIDQLKDIVSALNTIHKKQNTPPILMVGFNRRFSPFIQKAAQILKDAQGPLFACYNINAGFIPKDSWIQDPNEGGGRIIGEVCHFVDTLRYLAGSPVKLVQAACVQTDNRSQMNRDSVTITLKYNNGSVGTILYHAFGNSNYPKERIEIAASGTTIVIDDFRRMDIYGSKKEYKKSKQDKGFDAEINAFVNSICNGGGAPIPVAEIIETSFVTFAVHESLNTGTCVEISEFASKYNLPELR